MSVASPLTSYMFLSLSFQLSTFRKMLWLTVSRSRWRTPRINCCGSCLPVSSVRTRTWTRLPPTSTPPPLRPQRFSLMALLHLLYLMETVNLHHHLLTTLLLMFHHLSLPCATALQPITQTLSLFHRLTLVICRMGANPSRVGLILKQLTWTHLKLNQVRMSNSLSNPLELLGQLMRRLSLSIPCKTAEDWTPSDWKLWGITVALHLTWGRPALLAASSYRRSSTSLVWTLSWRALFDHLVREPDCPLRGYFQKPPLSPLFPCEHHAPLILLLSSITPLSPPTQWENDGHRSGLLDEA